jgi:two-component system, OmpR family, response regulator MprA
MILDVNLPDLSGLDVCRRVRADALPIPILMLTARAAVEDRVAGLDAGADDYLVKPFALAELLARVRALLRRSLGDGAGAGSVLSFADVELDLDALVARRGGRVLELTRTELRLLELFLRNPGRVLTRDQMLDRVWGVDARTSSNGVEVYVGYLRRKLEAGGEPRLVQTVRGVGYRLGA